MLALVQITGWHWAGFIGIVIVLLALDLGVFHHRAHVVHFREALLWTAIWFCLAMLFALWLRPMRGQTEALQFLTGYLIELSLSMDNVFIIALIFGYFHVPAEHQHRVLFWGILGALVMRGLMIAAGVALISSIDWILYVFGAFLVYSGIKMLFVKSGVDPENKRALTPLALVLLMVETTDLIFALDSIPAVFAVTKRPFIVFTSNVFAILGLRSLYFVLAGAIKYFRFLKYGLSLVLVFIGVKMLIDPGESPHPYWWQADVPTSISLLVVGGIIFISILLSVVTTKKDDDNGEKEDGDGDKRQRGDHGGQKDDHSERP
jgi:tellurite resistance protein TerC